MRFIISWLLNPLFIFFLLVGVSLVYKIRKQEKKFFVISIVAVFWIWLFSFTPIPQLLIYSLERQYAPFKIDQYEWDNDSSAPYILVLGGGHTNSPSLPASMQLTSTAMHRLTEAIRIHSLLPQSKIIFSGYSFSNRVTQAEMLANASIELGISPEDTLLSKKPSNTFEELELFKQRFRSVSPIIITSASHMPRVMLICKRLGISAKPAPTEYFIKEDSEISNFDFYPSSQKLVMTERSFHEIAGMIQFNFFGKSFEKDKNDLQ